MEFTDASSLPWFARPLLDGLLALNIDLAMDTIAIRLGMWDWGRGLQFHYFGVPFANFWAWFWVVSSFSLGYRILARQGNRLKTWLAPATALLTGLSWVLVTNWLISFHIPFKLHWLAVVILILGALGIVIAFHPKFHQQPAPALVFWVPFISHLYFLIVGAISGVIFEPPFLLFVSLLMFVVALLLHQQSIKSIFGNIH
jgi:hypothetical protein